MPLSKKQVKIDLIDTGLLNESAVSPIHVDASMTKSSRQKHAIQNNILRTVLDLGKFNDFKLSDLYQSYYEQRQKGQIICLAYIDKDKGSELTINPAAVDLFRKYCSDPVCFVGNFGRKQSGKSFWYDKILNLSQVQGAQYSKIQTKPGLYFWSIPYVKNNLKIFMIDFCKSKDEQGISGEDQKLLDLQLILSQTIVLIHQPSDQKVRVTECAYGSFHSSMMRLSSHGSKTSKQTSYWPHSIYNLHRSTKAISPQSDKLSHIFSDYNYSIIHDALNTRVGQHVSQSSLIQSSLLRSDDSSRLLNDKYIKMTSLVFKDIYKKLIGKKYQGLSYTAQVIPFILMHTAKNLNLGQSIQMDKMIEDVRKDIYDWKLQTGKSIYDFSYDILKQSVVEQQTRTISLQMGYYESQKIDIRIEQDQHLNSKQINRKSNVIKKTSSRIVSDHQLRVSSKPQPLPMDQLLEIFRKTNENVMNGYHQSKYDAVLHLGYEKILIQYGQNKEKKVLEYNNSETDTVLMSKLPNFTVLKDIKQLNSTTILAYLTILRKQGLRLDHDRCKQVSERLNDVCFPAIKHQYFHLWMTEQSYKIRKLQTAIQDKKKQLNDLRNNKNTVILMNSHQPQQLLDQHNRSTDKIQKLRDLIDLDRKKSTGGISDKQYIKQLQKHRKKLQGTIKDNEKKLRNLNLTPSKDPRVSLLQQKFDDKKTLQLQVQAGLQNLASSRLSSTSSILSSRKTQIRKIRDRGQRRPA